jgi:DNA-binding transcriptional LysR family regulator
LLPRVRAVVDLAGALYRADDALDLSTLNRKVVIASTAYFEARAIASFVKHAQDAAPGLKIETKSLAGGFPKAELESGEIDLAIAAYFDDLPNGYRLRTIFSDRFVCVCAKSNPYLRTAKRLSDYLKLRHLQIEVPPGVFAPADRYLQSRKKVRNIALRVGNFLTPAQILSETDYLLTCPFSLAIRYREAYQLVITDLPFKLSALDTKMVWHDRNQHDAFHAWLRNTIANIGEQPTDAGAASDIAQNGVLAS